MKTSPTEQALKRISDRKKGKKKAQDGAQNEITSHEKTSFSRRKTTKKKLQDDNCRRWIRKPNAEVSARKKEKIKLQEEGKSGLT